MRYLADNSVDPADAAKFIEDFKDEGFGTKLSGIVKADQAAHAPKDAPSREALIKKAVEATPLGEIYSPKLAEEFKDRFGVVWGEMRDGKFVVMGIVNMSENKILAEIAKAGASTMNAQTGDAAAREEMKANAEHFREMNIPVVKDKDRWRVKRDERQQAPNARESGKAAVTASE